MVFLIFFFSFSVRELKFNTSLWKVPALEGLRGGENWLAGPSVGQMQLPPGSGFFAVGFWGKGGECVFSSLPF